MAGTKATTQRWNFQEISIIKWWISVPSNPMTITKISKHPRNIQETRYKNKISNKKGQSKTMREGA